MTLEPTSMLVEWGSGMRSSMHAHREKTNSMGDSTNARISPRMGMCQRGPGTELKLSPHKSNKLRPQSNISKQAEGASIVRQVKII